jgi:hypothetical protein
MRKSASWAPAPNLKVLAVERNETNWIVVVDGLDHATCPVCGIQSISRHSSYRRTLQDLSAQGKPVSVRVRMTRWRCRNDRCERRIFAERLPELTAPFARRTTRLAGIVRLFGHGPRCRRTPIGTADDPPRHASKRHNHSARFEKERPLPRQSSPCPRGWNR